MPKTGSVKWLGTPLEGAQLSLTSGVSGVVTLDNGAWLLDVSAMGGSVAGTILIERYDRSALAYVAVGTIQLPASATWDRDFSGELFGPTRLTFTNTTAYVVASAV